MKISVFIKSLLTAGALLAVHAVLNPTVVAQPGADSRPASQWTTPSS